jgi:hypothetical protein
MNNTTWTDLAGTYNCDANTTNAAASLPSAAGWSSIFNGAGVQIRLVRISDSAVAGTFASTLTCTAIGSSATPTPDIDEDCNRNWDNYGPRTASVAIANRTFGAAYSCTATHTSGGLLYDFEKALFTRTALNAAAEAHAGAGCASLAWSGNRVFNVESTSLTGTVPNCADATQNNLCMDTTSCQVDPGSASNSFRWLNAISAWHAAACQYGRPAGYN